MADPRKLKGLFSAAGSVAAAVSAAKGLQTAREDKDRLALAHAIGSVMVAVTSVLIAVRALRKGGK